MALVRIAGARRRHATDRDVVFADLQITGFGLSSTYHANNEYCLLSDMKCCLRVCARIIKRMDRHRTDSRGEKTDE